MDGYSYIYFKILPCMLTHLRHDYCKQRKFKSSSLKSAWLLNPEFTITACMHLAKSVHNSHLYDLTMQNFKPITACGMMRCIAVYRPKQRRFAGLHF